MTTMSKMMKSDKVCLLLLSSVKLSDSDTMNEFEGREAYKKMWS